MTDQHEFPATPADPAIPQDTFERARRIMVKMMCVDTDGQMTALQVHLAQIEVIAAGLMDEVETCAKISDKHTKAECEYACAVSDKSTAQACSVEIANEIRARAR